MTRVINHHRRKRSDPRRHREFDADQVDVTLRIIEIALRRGCADEAKAAIDRYFAAITTPLVITEQSGVHQLGISVRPANTLEANGIMTLADLRRRQGELWQITNFGPGYVRECLEAVARADGVEFDGDLGG